MVQNGYKIHQNIYPKEDLSLKKFKLMIDIEDFTREFQVKKSSNLIINCLN